MLVYGHGNVRGRDALACLSVPSNLSIFRAQCGCTFCRPSLWRKSISHFDKPISAAGQSKMEFRSFDNAAICGILVHTTIALLLYAHHQINQAALPDWMRVGEPSSAEKRPPQHPEYCSIIAPSQPASLSLSGR